MMKATTTPLLSSAAAAAHLLLLPAAGFSHGGGGSRSHASAFAYRMLSSSSCFPPPSLLPVCSASQKGASIAPPPCSLHVLPTSVYVHLPFCKRRCFYCDFPIVAVGERSSLTGTHIDSVMENYVEFISREMVATFNVFPASPLKTVFFGGGTPSLLPPSLFERILKTLEGLCGFDSSVEISLEMDPGTFDLTSLNGFMGCGVNRVSLGVQTFQEELLRACGRSHGLREICEAIGAIHASGLKNWSLDLISSLPHQTFEMWKESLRRAVDSDPAHISVYDLQVEEGTKFWQWYKPGQSPLPSEEKAALFYKFASSALKEASYQHYEISNYAKKGYQCKHNLIYWQNLPYHAFGLGSTSYVRGLRFPRPKKLKEYYDFVQDLEAGSGWIANVKEDIDENACDTLMLSLRLARGLDIRDFATKFGSHLTSCVIKSLIPFVKSGHAVALDPDDQPLCSEALSQTCQFVEDNSSWSWSEDQCKVVSIGLSDPEGFLFSNEIISSVFSSLPG